MLNWLMLYMNTNILLYDPVRLFFLAPDVIHTISINNNNGEVDCIIADQSYLGILETNHEGFTDETRLIYKMEIQEELKAVTTKTDVTENPFIVYLTGIDTYGSVSTISRADVNLVVCVNPLEKQVLMVSVPRDTQINLHKNGKMDKITHSAMYGISPLISFIPFFIL